MKEILRMLMVKNNHIGGVMNNHAINLFAYNYNLSSIKNH